MLVEIRTGISEHALSTRLGPDALVPVISTNEDARDRPHRHRDRQLLQVAPHGEELPQRVRAQRIQLIQRRSVRRNERRRQLLRPHADAHSQEVSIRRPPLPKAPPLLDKSPEDIRIRMRPERC
jgi:hypothetical protein